jgi:hypothetical protein
MVSKHLLSALDSGEDAVGIGGSDERFWIGICLCDEAVDGGPQFVDGSEAILVRDRPAVEERLATAPRIMACKGVM